MVEEELPRLLAEGLWVIGWLAQLLFTVYFHFTCESVITASNGCVVMLWLLLLIFHFFSKCIVLIINASSSQPVQVLVLFITPVCFVCVCVCMCFILLDGHPNRIFGVE